VRRREFITLLGGAAATWPLASRAQQPAVPVIGLVRSTSPADSAHIVAAFRQGLKQIGFVEGQDCAIEYRWADNQLDRLPALVADLLRFPVAVIVANTPAAFAAKAATTAVPIVFAGGGDPVRDGLVASLARPGGNVTGLSMQQNRPCGQTTRTFARGCPRSPPVGDLGQCRWSPPLCWICARSRQRPARSA
jgi:putative ABC transport system substrate-binding protein